MLLKHRACLEAYNDREVRVHITRLRELLTNFQPAVPTLGVDQAIAYLPAVGGNVGKSSNRCN